MSSIHTRRILAALCTVAFVFALAVGVDAQSNKPIDEDDIVASVQVGNEFWVAPVALQTELEDVTGLPAVIETMGSLLSRLPAASTQNAVRFEGHVPGAGVSADLDDLGYTDSIALATPLVPGATHAVLRVI